MHETTVLVVGGGATGVSVARDLALRDIDVTLVDRDALAAGTTGRSHGVLHSGARYAERDPDDAADCLAENRLLRDIAAGCLDETGGYFLQLAADDPAYFERKRAACADLGMAVETLSGDELRERVPAASPAVERAFAVPDAVVSPARLVVATAADARDAGARLYAHSPVEAIDVSGGHVDTVAVGGRLDAMVDAEVVVNATGPWAERCAALAGVDVPMQPTCGVMVAVENPGVGTVLNRCRPPADGDIVVPRGDEAVLGTTSVAVDDPDDFERPRAAVERVLSECAAMCPALAERAVERTYWGVRPLYAPDEAVRGDARSISRGFALLDHADAGAAGFVTVVGGKLTTARKMAAATADHVCERLGIDRACRTAEEPLPGADDPARLDALVAEFTVDAPADGR
ncbi:FAD-dependent oxidoreductase [Haloplanus halobius]|uniref:FAD-dependent oxidoreductase n=1 Tax=Haloplanus halobius TaxID=2934938 RepID=UPI00200BD1EE|nr:FAD-dependent oxidoreductase [Haloplanus sp. XH21]